MTKFENFRIQELPAAKLTKIWGGAESATAGGSQTHGEGTSAQVSFKYTGDTANGNGDITHYDGYQCTDGCGAAVSGTVINPEAGIAIMSVGVWVGAIN